MLSYEQILELASLVAEKGLAGLEIERAGFRLNIVGQSVARVATADDVRSGQSVVVSEAVDASNAAPSGATTGVESLAVVEAPELEGHTLTSPIVGTFYEAPSPDADPFVRVGDRVSQGQVVCIVEAMKLMNEIESDVDGVILQVFPQNAQPVEFGEPLFLIQTDG